MHGFKRTTLRNRIQKIKNSELKDGYENNQQYSSKHTSKQVFTKIQERKICKYFKKSSNLHHGFTYSMARKFGYEYATINNINIPTTWLDNETAGEDWI